jgi:hypothetical protein
MVMKKELSTDKNKIFILGAGASFDYGLPVWDNLSSLIRNYLKDELVKNNKLSKEILEWLDLIGEDKKYKTLDECIFHESSSDKYKENGQDIEFEIFRILKEIFTDLYDPTRISWIKNLNEKIRKKEGLDWNNIFFINYNYDSVLADNILNFNYLTKTERERIYRERIQFLSRISSNQSFYKIPCLYPHGLFEYSDRGFLREESDTINSYDHTLLQATSCFHGKEHNIIFHPTSGGVDLYILGLSGGLKINLKKLIFNDNSKINNVFITIRPSASKTKQENDKMRKDIITFLKEKFNMQEENIKIYDDCISLIEGCFLDF